MALTIRTIREAWHNLHGVFAIYKPVDMSPEFLRKCLINNICRDINQLEPRPPRGYVEIRPNEVDPLLEPPKLTTYTVVMSQNYADLELVNGPPIQPTDLRVSWAKPLGRKSSGVVVFGVNRGNRELSRLTDGRPLSVYQIKGQFGLATDTHWVDGKVWEKTTFHHLTQGKLDRVLASIQASNQRTMFDYCGVSPTSQAAYELASKGLLRPAAKGPTVVYNIKTTHFEPPSFTLEIHCINETEPYFPKLIHDLGLSLKTTAVCEQIRRIRYGCFTVDDALLRKHWTLEHFSTNMALCRDKIASLPDVTPNFASFQQPTETASEHV